MEVLIKSYRFIHHDISTIFAITFKNVVDDKIVTDGT
jgi:hypothetical protein